MRICLPLVVSFSWDENGAIGLSTGLDCAERHREPVQPDHHRPLSWNESEHCTSQIGKAKMPTHIVVDVKGLAYRSVVLTEQVRTLDKRRLEQYLDRLSEKQMESVDQALKVSLDLENDNR